MRRQSLLFLAIFFIGIPAARGAEEKSTAGRTQSEWIKILQTDERARLREGAVVALGIIGPKERRAQRHLLRRRTECR